MHPESEKGNNMSYQERLLPFLQLAPIIILHHNNATPDLGLAYHHPILGLLVHPCLWNLFGCCGHQAYPEDKESGEGAAWPATWTTGRPTQQKVGPLPVGTLPAAASCPYVSCRYAGGTTKKYVVVPLVHAVDRITCMAALGATAKRREWQVFNSAPDTWNSGRFTWQLRHDLQSGSVLACCPFNDLERLYTTTHEVKLKQNRACYRRKLRNSARLLIRPLGGRLGDGSERGGCRDVSPPLPSSAFARRSPPSWSILMPHGSGYYRYCCLCCPASCNYCHRALL